MGFTERLPNGKFRARWFDPAGTQRSRTFDREKEAAQFVRNVLADIDRSVYVDDKAGRDHVRRVRRSRSGSCPSANSRSVLAYL